MGGAGSRSTDVPESYWSTFEAGLEEPKKVVCAHCGNPRKEDVEKCEGCGSREIK